MIRKERTPPQPQQQHPPYGVIALICAIGFAAKNRKHLRWWSGSAARSTATARSPRNASAFRDRVEKQRDAMREEMYRRERARRNVGSYMSAQRASSDQLRRDCERLGIDPRSAFKVGELKKAYRRQAMKWHPDRLHSFSSENAATRRHHDEVFKHINESYRRLRDIAEKRGPSC